jgi:hypothetical protein
LKNQFNNQLELVRVFGGFHSAMLRLCNDGAWWFRFVLLGDMVGSKLGSLVGVEVGLRLLGK